MKRKIELVDVFQGYFFVEKIRYKICLNDNKEHVRLWCNVFLLVVLLATCWWFFAEIYTARSWINPQYRFYANAISDLGAIDHHINDYIITPDREVFSPLHNFFNIMMISQGVIYMVFVGLLCSHKRGIFLSVSVGVGLIITGLVPSSAANVESGLSYIHQIGCLFPLIGGPLNTFLISKRLDFVMGKVIGIVGTICGILVPITYHLGISAIPQRIAVYSIFLGLLIIALRSTRHCMLPYSKK